MDMKIPATELTALLLAACTQISEPPTPEPNRTKQTVQAEAKMVSGSN
jgi:uncharacterized lipoprotein YbaY